VCTDASTGLGIQVLTEATSQAFSGMAEAWVIAIVQRGADPQGDVGVTFATDQGMLVDSGKPTLSGSTLNAVTFPDGTARLLFMAPCATGTATVTARLGAEPDVSSRVVITTDLLCP